MGLDGGESLWHVLQMVLNKTGRDVNAQDNEGNTLLHMICRIDCNYSHEAAKEMYKKVKLLLEAGADAGITNNKEETALMLASTDNLKGKIVATFIIHEKAINRSICPCHLLLPAKAASGKLQRY